MNHKADTSQAPLVWLALADATRAQVLATALRRDAPELQVRLNDRGASFLRAYRPRRPSVILLDAWLPDLETHEVLDRLAGGGQPPMFCLRLEHPNTPAVVRAMRRGAFDCVEGGQGSGEVARILRAALEEDRRRAAKSLELGAFGERLAALTRRQRQILEALLKGVTSKELARELDLSKKTIDFHRSQILRRLGVHSLVEAAVLVCSQEDRPTPTAPPPVRVRNGRVLPKVP